MSNTILNYQSTINNKKGIKNIFVLYFTLSDCLRVFFMKNINTLFDFLFNIFQF